VIGSFIYLFHSLLINYANEYCKTRNENSKNSNIIKLTYSKNLITSITAAATTITAKHRK